MDAKRGESDDAATNAGQCGDASEPARDEVLRARYIEHCAWMATWDKNEAIRAFNWYDQLYAR
jgi:hypothetical protein